MSQITFTLSSRLTLQSEVDVVDSSDRRMHSTILSLLTDPFPLLPPVSLSHAAHAPVLRCLHVKLNFYTNRERERAAAASTRSRRHKPLRLLPKSERITGYRRSLAYLYCMLSITSDCEPPLMMINATNCPLKFRHI